MSQHVPEDLLISFVEGDVGEQLAVHIAEHVDACPVCSTRAAGLEPLAAAFASLEDPATPDNLARSVLAAVAEPEPVPTAEIALGASLLVAATILATMVKSPVGLAIDLGFALHAMIGVARALAAGLGASSIPLGTATLFAFLGCALTARIATPLALGIERRVS